MTDSARLVFHFMDGSMIDADLPPQTDDRIKMIQNVRRAMDVDKLMLEMDGQLFMIPLNNIKYVQVSPSPEELPEGVLRGAVLMG